jgi:Flp pilus assembly protein TadD
LAWAYEIYAWFLGGLGRLDEAIAKDKKAIKLDPLNSFFQSALAYFLYHARRYDDAIVQIRKTLELDPASTLGRHLLGCCLLWKGDTAGAIAEFQASKIVVTARGIKDSSATLMPFLEIDRKPDRSWATSKSWQSTIT